MNEDYIAGFFDGEGSICYTIRRSNEAGYGYHIRPMMRISQKDKQILEEIEHYLNRGRIISANHTKIRWTQKAYSLFFESYPDLKFLCGSLTEKVHVKKKQILLLNEYLCLKAKYNHASFEKEVMLRFLEIALENSRSCVKPNSKYQAKVLRIIEEVTKSNWSPKYRYNKMSESKRAKQEKGFYEQSHFKVTHLEARFLGCKDTPNECNAETKHTKS